MKKILAFSLLAAALGSAPAAFGQVSIGVSIGPPPAPRVIRVRPRQPGPDFMWVDGYWYAERGRWIWHNGYWTRAPFGGARWVAPRYEGGRFIAGFWDGPGGRVDHDHHWDKDKRRDFDHDRDHDHGRDHDHH